MKLKRRVLAVLLTLAVMVTFMPFISQQAYAAGSSKVQVVTKAKSNDGNTSYTYNKKGLVSKSVYKSSSKDNDSDSTYTVTTTYKYNKKNKVAKKTATYVQKTTSYDTDKTTGKTRTANLGTVTNTWKDVTVYTYNKKGLAKKAVTTSTFTKAGSNTNSYKNRRIGYWYYDDDYSLDELTDGRIIAGYNHYDSTGKYTEDETSANAYYYTGAVNDAVRSGTTTTTFVDNGNGSYTEVYDSNVTSSNYETKQDAKYYRYDENGNVVECTADEYDYEEGFKIVNSENVTLLDSSKDEFEKTHRETTHQDKTVTTTTYTYKKGRVSKAVATAVNTEVVTSGSYSYADNEDGYNYTYSSNEPDTTTKVTTTTTTTTYTYDKKGRAKKSVVSDNGVENYVETKVSALPNYSYSYSDGKTTSVVGSGADCESTTTTQVANGTKTVTYTPNKYIRSYTYSDGTTGTGIGNEDAKATVTTSTVKATPSKDTYKYTYDKNGNIKKIARTGSETEEVKLRNETFGNALFEFDAAGKAIVATTVVSHSKKETTNKETSVKTGTKRLNKSLSMGTYSFDGSKSTGYDLNGRVVYTLKAKNLKSSLAKIAEQQQWIIQNGALNGVVGLN